MAIAPSEGVIVWSETTRGDTKPHLAADLHSAVSQAGWGSEAIAGGFKYTLASKQLLGCKVKIWDRTIPGRDDLLTIQFMSLDETRLGALHVLAVRPGRFFQVHVNRCQIFISVAGVSNSILSDATSLGGGIPFIPEDDLGTCGDDVGQTLTTEAWWSNGDAAQGSSNFRNDRKTTTWSACHNGDLMSTDDASYSELARMRLIPVTLAVNVDFFFGPTQRTRHFGTLETPLFLDPLIQWGSGAVFDSVALYRGEIYDALWVSLARPLDYFETRFGADWVNYSYDDNLSLNRTKFGCLYLMRGVTPPAAKPIHYVY